VGFFSAAGERSGPATFEGDSADAGDQPIMMHDPNKQHFTISRHVSAHGGFLFHALRFSEIALVSVYFDQFASHIVNTDHGIM